MSAEESPAETPRARPDERRRERPHPAGNSTRRLSADEVHDVDRVRKAIGELTRADLGRLQVAAKTLLGGFRIGPQQREYQDLLSTAITLTLSGERQWRKRVDFKHHLFRTMRSIASHWRREMVQEHEARSPIDDLGGETEAKLREARDWEKELENLIGGAAEEVFESSDEEIEAELRSWGEYPDEVAEEVRTVLLDAVDRYERTDRVRQARAQNRASPRSSARGRRLPS
ncbi:MAG: hypothetical protein V3T72_14135 [Thermoanaerobaculia bacterium]